MYFSWGGGGGGGGGGGYRATGTIGNFLYKRGVSDFHLVQFNIIHLLINDAHKCR